MISPTSIFPGWRTGAKRTSERGQISIFFASSLIVLISIIAFIINIGLFVKAKINLQNAVDAAAYSGAAVQSRMLNKIGYLNWEMRNVFKEWMFKYYVLGNLNIENVRNPGSISGDRMNFGMRPDPNVIAGSGQDVYNFPSVCLHYAGVPTNVCERYALPGIPRFEPTNLVGIDETTSSFIDAIVTEKSDDCSKRTRLNYNVANMWAYQVLDPANASGNSAFADAPQIAADRPGAWPTAVELAMRTRNLEFAMNRAPLSGVCAATGAAAGSCGNQIGALTTEKNYGNERPIKAFYSAFRNLGSDGDSEMRNSFTLTELSPTPVQTPEVFNTSTTLMFGPAKQTPKYYVDLKLMMVNYATFFTGLIAGDNSIRVDSTTVGTQGACDVSKIAIPVPGYPVGFYKNPEVLTYYAVKGQSRFLGLFNPFAGNGVVMTAWAAAKPMGGRVGPALFVAKPSDPSLVVSRTTSDKGRSSSYLSGLNLTGVLRKGTSTPVPVGQYAPGMPIPINNGSDPTSRFWITEPTDNVGGWLSGQEIVFGIPNLAYDFITGFTNVQYDSSTLTSVIVPANPASLNDYGNGLYRADQFNRFKANLLGTTTPDEVNDSIVKARAPTKYEIANYTIPTLADKHLSDLIDGAYSDNFGFATGRGTTGSGAVEVRRFSFYAPLYGANTDVMFKSADDVVATINEFIEQQVPAMTKYRDSLNKVARNIFIQDPDRYAPAARRISDIDFAGPVEANPQSCDSIAGQFLFYYFGAGSPLSPAAIAGCPRPLRDSLTAYYNSSLGNTFSKYMYVMEMTVPDATSGLSFDDSLTGYMPGPLRGANNLGQLALPFPSSNDIETMRRSGYSTKFVTLKSLTSGGGYAPGSGGLATYSEGRPAPLNRDVVPTTFRNPLTPGANIPATVTH